MLSEMAYPSNPLRVFTACEPRNARVVHSVTCQNIPWFFTGLLPRFPRRGAARPWKQRRTPGVGPTRERKPAERVFTTRELETQGVVHNVIHRSIRGFFTGPSPAFARAWQSLRVVRRTTASPSSYHLLLHRPIRNFSTGLSPAHQPVIHNLSTGLSTGCAGHRRSGGSEAIEAHRRAPARMENGSAALIPAPGLENTGLFCDECKARIETLTRWFDYNSSAVKVNL
jgi:hypothetical protein